VNGFQFNDWWDTHIPPVWKFIGFRPDITREMYQIPFMRGGYETGATFHGDANFMVGDDPITKVHIGHATFTACALVYNSAQVQVGDAVYAYRYMGGKGSSIVKSAHLAHESREERGGDILIAMILWISRDSSEDSQMPTRAWSPSPIKCTTRVPITRTSSGLPSLRI
jgi:hypothetical protein